MPGEDDNKYRTRQLERVPKTDPARQEEIEQLQKLLNAHRRTLGHYLNQQAALGTAHAPPAITSGIYEAREHIKQIKHILREWGTPVEDRLGDEHQDNPTLASVGRPISWIVGGVLALVAVALLAVVLLNMPDRSAPSSQAALPTAVLKSTDIPVPTAIPSATPIPTVQPVAEGKYMVLVAELEPINTDRRDLTRLIAASLERTFERDFPLSKLIVRTYQAVVTSDAQALDVAERSKAAVIVWGKYFGDKRIQLNVQVGSLAPFPHTIFDRRLIEQTANLQIQFDDPVEQSIAPQVLNVVNVMHVADGNIYDNGRILELLGRMQMKSPELTGSSTADRLQRFMRLYFNDTPGAIVEIGPAIDLEPQNPLLFIFRSSALARLGRYDEARQDAATAERLAANKQWTEPLQLYAITALFAGDLDQAQKHYDQIVRMRPHDWLVFVLRGLVHYNSGDYQRAREDLQQSIQLGPEANFPYLLLAQLDLHEGKLEDASQQMAIAASKFPDANAANRLLSAYIGDTRYGFAMSVVGFGNLQLGRYIDVVQGSEDALDIKNPPADLYLARGLALCVGKHYPEAEAAYSRGLDLDPTFALLHLLRAEARLKQQNEQGAFEDLAVVQQSPLAPYLESAQAGKLSCETLLATQ